MTARSVSRDEKKPGLVVRVFFMLVLLVPAYSIHSTALIFRVNVLCIKKEHVNVLINSQNNAGIQMLNLTGNISLEFTGELPSDLSVFLNSSIEQHPTWIDPHSAGSVKLKEILSFAEQHLTISGSDEKSCSYSPQRPPGYVCFELPRDTVALKGILGARLYNSFCKSFSGTVLFSEISKKHPTLSKLTCNTTVLQSDNSSVFSSQSVQRQMFLMTKNGLCIHVDHSIYLDSRKMPGAIFFQTKEELTDAGVKRWGENGSENWFMMASVHNGQKILSTGFGSMIQLGDDPENIINSLSW